MRHIAMIVAGVALAAGMPALAAKVDRVAAAEAKLAKALEGRVAGEPVRCLPLSQVRESTVYDRTAIVYRVGRKLYVNRPDDAFALNDDDVLVTWTTGSQLCNIDVVRLVDRQMGFQRGFVMLGKFVPYSRVEQALN